MRSSQWLMAFFAAWAGVALYCVWGFPPCVDLAGHGAQMQALADWLRGDERLRALYDVRFHVGYGLPLWLFLPVALVFNGATAARFGLWLTLMLFPLSGLAMARAFKRADWLAVLMVPFAFNISYWYGLLPGLFAQPVVFFSLAAFKQGLVTKRARWFVGSSVLFLVAALSHLLTGGALGAAMLALVVLEVGSARRSAFLALCGVSAPSVLVAAGEVARLLRRSVVPEEHQPETDWNLDGHTAWFFRVYGPEGVLAVLLPVLLTIVCVVVFWRRRSVEARQPFAVFVALLACFVVMPKTAGGIYLACTRLPVLVGMAAMFIVDLEARWLRRVLLGLCAVSLTETLVFHARFAAELRGLEAFVERPTPTAPHGYVSLVGTRLLGSKHIYLEHSGQWWTATRGGVGHHFFADADHHPVHFKPGHELPQTLTGSPVSDWAPFVELLVFGDGALPEGTEAWTVAEQHGAWRRLERKVNQ